MKLIFATIIAVIAMTGCATGSDAYYNAVAAREKRLAEQEMLADTAIADMAAKGDAQARGMGIMYFALKAAGSKAGQQMIAAPKTVAEQILPWAALLVPSLTQVYGIKAQTDVAIINSNNSVKNQESSNDMIVDLVKGRKEPIVGQQGDVLLYGN
jgi:hypothetical protein